MELADVIDGRLAGGRDLRYSKTGMIDVGQEA
jgi:hypothetical protein